MLFKKVIFSLIICSCSLFCHSQQELVNHSNVDEDSLFLIAYRTVYQDTLGIYSLQKDSNTLIDKTTPLGFYSIHGNGWKSADFILSPSENAHISIENNGQLKITNSRENELHNKLQADLGALNTRLSNIELLRSNTIDSMTLIKYHGIIDELEREKKRYIDSVYEQNKDSFSAYTSQVYLTKVSESTVKTNLDFSPFNEAVLKSTIVPHVIMNYLKNHTNYNETGFKKTVDHLITSSSHPQIKEFTLGYLLKLFNEVGPKIVYDYLVEKHVLDGYCSDNSLVDETVYQSYLNVQIGAKIENFRINDVDLETIASNEEHIILFFWSSHCGHCEAILPNLMAEYSNLKAAGYEVLSISLDDSIETHQTLSSKFPWISSCDGQSWGGEIPSYLHINRTPSFVIVDQQLKIVAKPGRVNELFDFVKNREH